MLFDEIGKKLENVIDRLPGGINVRPLIKSSVAGHASGCPPAAVAEIAYPRLRSCHGSQNQGVIAKRQ